MTTTSSFPTTPRLRTAPLGALAAIMERGRDLLDRVPLSPVQVMLRIAVANVFWTSAMTKIATWDATVSLFENEYQVPLLPAEVAAYVGTTFELACPVLLVLGLLTRLATLPLLGLTFVIQTFVYPESWPDHLIWASILLVLLLRGAGSISLDHVISRRLLQP